VPGNYLRQSVINAGLDPDHLPSRDKTTVNFEVAKAAETVLARHLGAGQSVGAIDYVLPAAEIIARMHAEYFSAKRDLCGQDAQGISALCHA
jgi:nitronate monooxygenase